MDKKEKFDVNDFLGRWQDLKDQMSVLERKLDNYKKFALNEMSKVGENKLEGDELVLTKKSITKTTIGKDDLPKEIWERYNKKCNFDAFYLTKKNKTASTKASKTNKRLLQ